MTWLAGFLLGAQVLVALLVAFQYAHAPDLEREAPADPGAAAPRVLAIVPARNEEANISACVAALCAQRHAALRVVVVDDSSADGTAERARAAGARVIAAGPLPDGWLGKNHACFVGAGAARADETFFWFVDADLRAGPDCLARMLAAAQRTGADLVSVLPRVETRSFWEHVAQALVAQIIYAWLPARDVNDPGRKAAAATGPCLLFRRSAYEHIGGHAAVRGEVVEDLRLAERAKASGRRLLYGRGIGLATLRMYDSLGAIVRGWSKNFHVALGRAPYLAPLVAAALFAIYGGPPVVTVLAAACGRSRAALVAGLATAVALLARVDLHRRYRLTLRHLWAMPLGAAVVAFILLRSALRRPVDWKGRAVR
jgi:glycosyltransferase involved in cell wall biosynthesis